MLQNNISRTDSILLVNGRSCHWSLCWICAQLWREEKYSWMRWPNEVSLAELEQRLKLLSQIICPCLANVTPTISPFHRYHRQMHFSVWVIRSFIWNICVYWSISVCDSIQCHVGHFASRKLKWKIVAIAWIYRKHHWMQIKVNRILHF